MEVECIYKGIFRLSFVERFVLFCPLSLSPFLLNFFFFFEGFGTRRCLNNGQWDSTEDVSGCMSYEFDSAFLSVSEPCP